MKNKSAIIGASANGTKCGIDDGIARSASGYTASAISSSMAASGSTKMLKPVGSAIKLVGMVPTKKIVLPR